MPSLQSRMISKEYIADALTRSYAGPKKGEMLLLQPLQKLKKNMRIQGILAKETDNSAQQVQKS